MIDLSQYSDEHATIPASNYNHKIRSVSEHTVELKSTSKAVDNQVFTQQGVISSRNGQTVTIEEYGKEGIIYIPYAGGKGELMNLHKGKTSTPSPLIVGTILNSISGKKLAEVKLDTKIPWDILLTLPDITALDTQICEWEVEAKQRHQKKQDFWAEFDARSNQPQEVEEEARLEKKQLEEEHAKPQEKQFAKSQHTQRTKAPFWAYFFFGWFGVHAFMEKRPLKGVIYLLTLGVWGFGWFFDVIAWFFKE